MLKMWTMDTSVKPPVKKWYIPLGRSRFIPEGSLIHDSVAERMALLPDYRPRNLPSGYQGKEE